jgi:hypothetical protein
MKDHVNKSMGIVTRIPEALARIKPTDPLKLVKRETRKKRNCSSFLKKFFSRGGDPTYNIYMLNIYMFNIYMLCMIVNKLGSVNMIGMVRVCD